MRLAWLLVVLAAVARPVAAEEAAEEEGVPGLPAVRGLAWQFHFDATFGAFGFAHSLYANPLPDQPSGNLTDNWFEGAAKPGISGVWTAPSAWQVYGKLSAAGERSFGTPPTLVGDSASSFQVEDLYLGWRSGKLFEGLGENALDFSFGRAPYKIGHGFLVLDGGAEGGSRGGYWSNIRKAFALAAIGRFKAGPATLEGFFLEKNELPEAASHSRVAGSNLEFAIGKTTTVGATYLRGFANELHATREGLNVYNLRIYTSPLPMLPGLAFEAEYAKEHNGDVLDSTGWTVQGSYELSSGWKPKLSYRFAYFQGDDPATSRTESFDPLFLGFYDWGTWWQGEIGSYLISNSNLITHQVRLSIAPSESVGTGLIFYKFLL